MRRYTTLHRPLLGGAGRGIDWQGCSKNFFRKSNYCTTFFKCTNVLCQIVKSNAVCNIYMIKSLLAAQMYDNVWSNECRKFLIFILSCWMTTRLQRTHLFVWAHDIVVTIVQLWFEVFVKHHWMACLKELNKDMHVQKFDICVATL